jgi:hypothetical protein
MKCAVAIALVFLGPVLALQAQPVVGLGMLLE